MHEMNPQKCFEKRSWLKNDRRKKRRYIYLLCKAVSFEMQITDINPLKKLTKLCICDMTIFAIHPKKHHPFSYTT